MEKQIEQLTKSLWEQCKGKEAKVVIGAGRRQLAARKMGDEAKKAMLLDPTKNTPELDAAVSEYLFESDGAATKPPKGKD